jgi:GTP-binding protein HflX
MSKGADIFVEDRLFATLDPLTREVNLGTGRGAEILLTDTVGFIRKLPHDLVASFRATLEETKEADLLLHVIDASHPTWEEQRLVVDDVLAELGVHDTPVLHVFNKLDRLAPGEEQAMRERMANLLPGSVFVSAVRPGGLEALREALLEARRASRPVTELRLSPSDGKLLAELHRGAEVLEQTMDDESGQLVVRVRADAALLARLQTNGPR